MKDNFAFNFQDTFWSHPKHEHLVKILKEHFGKAEELQNNTKVIIFCQVRKCLSQHNSFLDHTN